MKDQKDKQSRFIFLQPVLIIFTRGAIICDHDCMFGVLIIHWQSSLFHRGL